MNPATSLPPTAATQAKFNVAYIWTISLVAALGGLLFGYDWVVIGGAKPFFERYFHLTSAAQSGWANSCALIGCLVGALVAGALSDKFGRKHLLLSSAFLFAGTSIGNALAPTFFVFVCWRILGGVAIGLASNLSPMYIAEVAPAQWRGRLVSLNQLTIVIGILLAQYLNWFLVRHLPQGATAEYIANSWYGQLGWRWMFALTAVPSVLFFLGMLFVPESPRWLVKNGRGDQAQRILGRIGGEAYAAAEVRDVQATLASQETQHVRFQDLLEPRMRKVLLLGVVLAVFQQWCGINVIFNYAEDIFRAAGYDISDVLKNIAWTGSVNLGFTFVALGIVDRGGRRVLMLFGAAGLAVIYAAMGFCYHGGVKGLPMLLLVLVAIGCYAMSLAPVTWVVISEIFPNRIRGAAMSVAVTSLWLACFLLTYTFPILNQGLGTPQGSIGRFLVETMPWLKSGLGPAGTFWLYGAICAAGLIFIFARLPETKGKSLEQIERELVGDSKSQAFPPNDA
ncbi:MAG TPA: sugar porter family MFS transporter [Candidatus Acidoferrum sp.]|jgi:sugar porter (SP) family MFS transporter|nr:sugar porter family MFS transporter [Candidatus Acidoferrum sp.]